MNVSISAKHLLIGLLLIGSFCSYTHANERPTITVCGSPAYPPISWIEEGHIIGLAPMLVESMITSLGYPINTEQDSNWSRCLKEVELGNIDMVVAAYQTERRKEFMQYLAEPIVIEPITLYYNKKNPIPSVQWEDLKGLKVGILFSDSFGDIVDQKIREYLRIEFVSTGVQNIQKLAIQRIDLMPLGAIGGVLQVKKLGFENEITSLPTPIVSDYWHVGISKRSPLIKHVDQLNNALIALKKAQAVELGIDKFTKRYINSDLSRKPTETAP
ncbi:substrate-binding periplasmic protein [Marinomonas algicola]|uniref:substrate-binding periplasmic protein n=1 Tax=Marinomonas algicola TaxID=2773454 RepID=UPI00174B5FCD|nr:transporter substrate-binding domain-containing protein [Marinomonas algicola]